LVYNTTSTGTPPNDLTPGFYYYNGSSWIRVDSNNSVKYVGAVSSTATPNGASITNSYLNLAPADIANSGVVTTTTQSFSGAKTFANDATVNSLTVGLGNNNVAQNTAIGYQALQNNTAGARDNTAIGYKALNLLNNDASDENTALGKESLAFLTNGYKNTALGALTLLKLNTGNNNVAVGDLALFNAITGSDNVSVGVTALFNSTGTSNNTAIGKSSLFSNISGNNNTGIGAGTDIVNGISNATAIGYGAVATASNMMRLGNGSVTVIQGQVPFSNSSDIRLKHDIQNTKYGLYTVMKLRPVDYILNSNNLNQVGFIAQEVKKLIPEVVEVIPSIILADNISRKNYI
jgi:hypothetical protein